MAANQRVVFTFDDQSLANLKWMTTVYGCSSMADTVREALRITRALMDQAKSGYSEIIVGNPDTGMERVITIPLMEQMAEDRQW